MAYDDAKRTADGSAYRGMRVGGEHAWRYTGEWTERKEAPDRWSLRFQAVKRRRVAAPDDSGAPSGASFDWLIVASQRARKVDANAYETIMNGIKWKVGTLFPGENLFTYERRGIPHSDVVIAYLEETVDLLRARKVPQITWADSSGV